DQRENRRARALALQIEREAALVAVQRTEHRIVQSIRVGAHGPARQIADLVLFNLDDVGAVVGEHLRAAGAEHDLGEVDHPDSGERKSSHSAASRMLALAEGTSPGSAPCARICFCMALTSA